MDIRPEIGRRLVTARKAAGQSVAQVADAVGVSRRMVQRIEAGDRTASLFGDEGGCSCFLPSEGEA